MRIDGVSQSGASRGRRRRSASTLVAPGSTGGASTGSAMMRLPSRKRRMYPMARARPDPEEWSP